jgi:hypothetical protein
MAEKGVCTKGYFYNKNAVSLRPAFEAKLSNCNACDSITAKGDPATVNVAKAKISVTITHQVSPGANFKGSWKSLNTGIGYKVDVNSVSFSRISSEFAEDQLEAWFPEIEVNAAQDVITVLYKGIMQKQNEIEQMIRKSLKTSDEDSWLAFASNTFVNKFKKLQDFTEYQGPTQGSQDVTFDVYIAIVPKSFNVCKNDAGRTLAKFKDDGKKCTYFNSDILDGYSYQAYIPESDSTKGRTICKDYFTSTSKTHFLDNNQAITPESLNFIDTKIIQACAAARSSPGSVIRIEGLGIHSNLDGYTDIAVVSDGDKHYIGIDIGAALDGTIDKNGCQKPYIGEKFVNLQLGNAAEIAQNWNATKQLICQAFNGPKQVFINAGETVDKSSDQNLIANTPENKVGNTSPNISPAAPVATPTPTRIEQVPAANANNGHQSGAQTRTGDTPIIAPPPSIKPRER